MNHQRPALRFFLTTFLIVGVFFLIRPSSFAPHNLLNICVVFHQHPSWYWAANRSRERWGVPVSTQMAVILQESHFNAAAKPAHERLLGLIPWFRPTSAEGYAQAVNSTWHLYLKDTGQNSANRSSFTKATDFIGWYLHRLQGQLQLPSHDVFDLYLAYHEGPGGFQRGSYKKQPKLISIAHHVDYRAARYREQLEGCEKKLPSRPWWRL